ncbi:MAG: hypothetical protein AAFX39_15365 [Pseudomonadota bacterium]
MIDVPASVDEITPEWINAALFDDCPPRVTAVKATSINNDRGFLSQTLRLELTYEAPTADRPVSVVAKIKPNDEAFGQAAAEVGAFEREIGFCR